MKTTNPSLKNTVEAPTKLKGIIQHTKQETIFWLLGSMAFGAIQAVLITLAFFSGPTTAESARDVEIAKLVLEKCEIFSTANLLLRRDGTKDVGCSIDLRFFNQLERMKKQVRKFKKKNKPKI